MTPTGRDAEVGPTSDLYMAPANATISATQKVCGRDEVTSSGTTPDMFDSWRR